MMLEMTLDTTKFAKAIGKMQKESSKETKQALAKVALKIEGDAKYNIQTGARTGRIYKRGSKTHQASSRGEFPKTDTGELVSNITSEFSFSGMEVTVGSRASAPHGFLLEFGTSKIAARPWLFPTVQSNKKFMQKTFANALSDIVRKK